MIERKCVETSNGTVKYLEAGEGKTIFMIHGGFGNAPDLMKWAQNVFPGFKIIVPFLPGHGSHDLKGDDYREILDSISQFGQKLDYKSGVLWGHSFGGRIVFDLLNQNLFEAKKAVLISPLLAPINKSIAKVALGVFNDYVGDLKLSRVNSRNGVSGQTYLKNFSKIWGVLTKLNETEVSINTPLLLIWAQNDSVVPLKDNKSCIEKLTPTTYKEFDGGHFNFFRNREISKVMKDFLDQLPD